MTGISQRLAVLAVTAAVLSACSTEIIKDVEVEQATRIVQRLEASGIGADQELERGTDQRYTIRVTPHDASAALDIIVEEGLATRRDDPHPALVPSLLEQRQATLERTAHQLERSLLAVGNVVAARVHFAAGEPAPLSPSGERVATTASVLLTHRGEASPLTPSEVAGLVAGAAADVAPERVSVVLKSLKDSSPPARQLVTLGPVSVTAGTALTAKLLLASALALFALSCGMLLLLWRRARRTTAFDRSRG